MSTEIVAVKQVGWLVFGAHVIGLCCYPEKPKLHFSDSVAPIFDVNLSPYRQPCLFCGKDLIERHCGVVLYDRLNEGAGIVGGRVGEPIS